MYRADRDCTPARTMTKRWFHVNPQSQMMSQHQANIAGILVLHKSKSTITRIKDTDPIFLFAEPTLYGIDQL